MSDAPMSDAPVSDAPVRRRARVVPADRVLALARRLEPAAVQVLPDGSVVFHLTAAPPVRLLAPGESAPDPYAPLTPDAP